MGSIISLYAVDNVKQFSTPEVASEVFTRNPKLFCSRFFTVIYLIFLSFKLGKFNNNKKFHFSRYSFWQKCNILQMPGDVGHLSKFYAIESSI